MAIISMTAIAVLAVTILFLFWLVADYNRLVHLRALLNEALSGIDVQLKRRYDLIPNLVETVKGYSKHEKEVFENVAKARSVAMHATTVQKKAQAEAELTQSLKTLFAVAESYPELKANENFMSLQKELSNIEHELQLSRRYYNGTARNYNVLVQRFPSTIVARIFNFESAPYFEVSNAAERENPQVKF